MTTWLGSCRFLVWISLCAIGLAMSGCGESIPTLVPLAKSDVIVAFGDSLTFGTGAKPPENYPTVLAQLIDRRVIAAGIPGETTEQGLARLSAVIAEHEPRIVIVCLGGNDMLRKVAQAETISNLRAIIQTLQARQIGVVLLGVPKPAVITSAAPFYAALAAEFDIPYEGEIVTDVLYHRDQKSDTIHPNAKGYRRIAEALAALLHKAGAV